MRRDKPQDFIVQSVPIVQNVQAVQMAHADCPVDASFLSELFSAVDV
jgi:hypothetical protein